MVSPNLTRVAGVLCGDEVLDGDAGVRRHLRAGKDGEGAVAGGVDHSAAVLPERLGEDVEVALLQPTPRRVAEAGEIGCGPDHVAEAEAKLFLETPLERLAQSGLQLDHPGEGEALEINGHRGIV